MAKKKATMTLKDFHGGSIPSDLPLPSAPGVTVRAMDRPVFDRPNPWANPMGRQDNRLKPLRNNFDNKTPFLGPNANIGRNFDEDERKPLDGGSGPRRTISDDSCRADMAKPDYSASFKQPPSQSIIPSAGSNSYAGRVSEPAHGGPYPNVWATRKEVAVNVADVSSVKWSGPDAVSKLAHASALDKISSGRWQSNMQTINNQQTNVEPVGYGDPDKTVNDGVRGGEKVTSLYEKERPAVYPDKTENLSPAEQSERPKLKLLPRSKPLDSSEPPTDNNQGYTQKAEHVHQIKSVESANNTTSGLVVAESGELAIDRPKLNLKPRSQALEQVVESTEKGRSTVFGGARPRELVLKERGIDDIVINNQDVVQPPNRVKLDLPRTEPVSPRLAPSRYNVKPEGTPLDNRTRKSNDVRDNRIDAERTDMQKKNWRSEKIGVKQQPPQERPPSPDTWRKPVEEPRPISSDGTGLRYGKAASAVKLAQAFSKSVSDPIRVDQFANQRGIPFSRLTGPGSRPQVNGY